MYLIHKSKIFLFFKNISDCCDFGSTIVIVYIIKRSKWQVRHLAGYQFPVHLLTFQLLILQNLL